MAESVKYMSTNEWPNELWKETFTHTQRDTKGRSNLNNWKDCLIPMFSNPIYMIAEDKQFQTEPKYFYTDKQKHLSERMN